MATRQQPRTTGASTKDSSTASTSGTSSSWPKYSTRLTSSAPCSISSPEPGAPAAAMPRAAAGEAGGISGMRVAAPPGGHEGPEIGHRCRTRRRPVRCAWRRVATRAEEAGAWAWFRPDPCPGPRRPRAASAAPGRCRAAAFPGASARPARAGRPPAPSADGPSGREPAAKAWRGAAAG